MRFLMPLSGNERIPKPKTASFLCTLMVSAEIFNGKEFALIVVSSNLWEFIWCDEWVKNILFLAKGIEKLTSLVYNITNIISYGGDFCGKKRTEYRPYRGGCCRAYC